MSREEALREQRTAALQELLSFRRPVDEALSRLGAFEWDCDEELVILTRLDALRALWLFKQEDLRVDEFMRWAQALEGREDLALESGFEQILKEFLFEISTPEINEPLTPELAVRWEGRLA
jgi:hypothetical protein